MSELIAGVASGAPQTLSKILTSLESGESSSEEIVSAYIEQVRADEKEAEPINGFVEIYDDALNSAQNADEMRRDGVSLPLLGLPFAIKDNIHFEGHSLSCGSRILADYRAPYSATVIERILTAGGVIIGRTNMDEFAMGSSCEYSAYGPSRNPANRQRTCGGSSGGSAAVVAAGQAPFALGSDTGGSVRLPASFCGVYGLKPTYGAHSRYGLVAFGSSLDQIGFLSNSPSDMALVFESTTGRDVRDETTAELGFDRLGGFENFEELRFAIPEELVGEGLDDEVSEQFDSFVAWLRDRGATVDGCSLPILDDSVAIYYIIAPAEASSNLSRYDGVKYGYRNESATTLSEMYSSTRMDGFGEEVKRRILIGNYVLSSGYYDAYYKKAQSVRRLLRDGIDEIFSKYDAIISPTAPTPAFPLGSRTKDPMAMYLTDVCTTFANLTGTPSISIPFGTTSGLPIGMQITGPRWSEAKLIAIAETYSRGGQL